MAPDSTIHLIRHAQGFHQLPLDHPDESIRDPELTPVGIEQCEHLRNRFFTHNPAPVELLCASPMRRAIQTARIAFQPMVDRGQKIVALPDAQEGTDVSSDTGSPVPILQKEFGDILDLRYVSDDWFVKSGQNAVDQASLEARAKRFRQWLLQREEKEIAVVSHGRFLHYVTGNIANDGSQTGAWWTNTLERSFRWGDTVDGDAALIETDASRKRTEGEH